MLFEWGLVNAGRGNKLAAGLSGQLREMGARAVCDGYRLAALRHCHRVFLDAIDSDFKVQMRARRPPVEPTRPTVSP